MPTNSPAVIAGGPLGTGTEATGASTARDATDVKGTSNPDLESVITAQNASTHQTLGHRRFVSRPLAAVTFAAADGNWTFDYAAYESNTNHSTNLGDGPQCGIYLWRPSTGLRVGSAQIRLTNGTLTTSEAHYTSSVSFGETWSGTQAILDGDILVFDIFSDFTQGMSSAYTDTFAYDGTTEASTTTCASFVTPPAALTLFTAGGSVFDSQQGALHDDPFSIQAVQQGVGRSSIF